MLYTQLAALALTAVTLVASGCGGSSKSGNSTTGTATTGAQTTTTTAAVAPISEKEVKIKSGAPLPRTVWIKKGNAVCTHTLAELGKTSTSSGSSTQEFGRGLTQVIVYERAELDELSKIVPPADKTGDWTQFLSGLQRFIRLSVQVAKYAQVNQLNTASSIVEAANTTDRQVRLIAKRDGLMACTVS